MPTNRFYLRGSNLNNVRVRLPSPQTIEDLSPQPIRRESSLVVMADVSLSTFESDGWIKLRLKSVMNRVFLSAHGIDNSVAIRLHVVSMISESSSKMRVKEWVSEEDEAER